MPGDDLRRLDWNVYARSERMYIRNISKKRKQWYRLFLDTSASHYGKRAKAERHRICAR